MTAPEPSREALRFVAGQLRMEAITDQRMARNHMEAIAKSRIAPFHRAQRELYETQASHREAVAAWLEQMAEERK